MILSLITEKRSLRTFILLVPVSLGLGYDVPLVSPSRSACYEETALAAL